ncbi:hypothetical protein QLQ12_32715 [Actinoplanes sp. NEAU-A12]|uniref:Uncharacterized protein n=1 Tax=Actinoplanes sandaracinus TaxID=3045177 RepID=A0ABT6WUG3_9ACTN|nr:hypothetical protein [Actinoplanes sandaracinus]MDI6103383.1 hypothetical protein [Actinoplanes sandaracinus]
MKSGSASSDASDARPPAEELPIWPPVCRARRVKTSTCRAASAAWTASSPSTSRKCGWMRVSSRAGMTRAARPQCPGGRRATEPGSPARSARAQRSVSRMVSARTVRPRVSASRRARPQASGEFHAASIRPAIRSSTCRS